MDSNLRLRMPFGRDCLKVNGCPFKFCSLRFWTTPDGLKCQMRANLGVGERAKTFSSLGLIKSLFELLSNRIRSLFFCVKIHWIIFWGSSGANFRPVWPDFEIFNLLWLRIWALCYWSNIPNNFTQYKSGKNLILTETPTKMEARWLVQNQWGWSGGFPFKFGGV